MKKKLSLILCLLLCAMTGCSGAAESVPDAAESADEVVVLTDAETSAAEETEALTETEAPAEETQAETSPERQPTEFDEWASNTFIATGANYITDAAGGVTYRTYFPVEQAGELEYCFYFSNHVDSTWARGQESYAGKPAGDYRILEAHLADGGISPEEEPAVLAEVTFDGSAERDVASGETFWSDPVTIDLPEGHYLVWEWTVEGTDIPCTRMSDLAYSYTVQADGTPVYNMDVPLPQLIGTKRETKTHLTFFGDSITQGCVTSKYENKFWVADVAEALGSDYSVWNCGLGYARSNDAEPLSQWIGRVKSGDVVTVAFGTNDLAVGRYGEEGPSSADAIVESLRTLVTELQSAGCTVILFNLPPFNFKEEREEIREEVNAQLPDVAEELGCAFFDWNVILENPDAPGMSCYGEHPDDEGCALIAQALLDQYGSLLRGETE